MISSNFLPLLEPHRSSFAVPKHMDQSQYAKTRFYKKKLCNFGLFKEPTIGPLNMAEIRHLENRHDVIFAEGGPIWIKVRRLVQNDMSTAVIWSKSKPDVEFQYGGRLGKFHGMSSQSHLPHCRVLPPGEFNGISSHSHVSHRRVLPLGEFTVMIPEPHATLQGAVTWRNQCHDRATLQGVIIPSAILNIVFRHVVFICGFLKCSLGFAERWLSYRLRYTCY